jgi:hypothetical protein
MWIIVRRLPINPEGIAWLKEKQQDIQTLFELRVLAVAIRREVGLCPIGRGKHDSLCGNRKTSVDNFGNVCYRQQ